MSKLQHHPSVVTSAANSLSMHEAWWEINDLNFVFDECNLINFNITYGKSSHYLPGENLNLTLKNSLYMGRVHDGKTIGSFVTVNNSKIFVVNTTVAEISSSDDNAIIQAKNSTLYLIDSRISRNNVSSYVLSLKGNSSLYAENCTVEDNLSTDGSVIFLSNSDGHIISCEMTGNSGNFGGVIKAKNVHELQDNSVSSDKNALAMNGNQKHLQVTECRFTNNNANIGGSIYLHDDITVQITDSTFVNNTANKGGVIGSEQHVYIVIDGCTFKSNSAIIYGGCIYLEQYVILIVNRSTAIENMVSNEGGVIRAEVNCSISIHDCHFIENKALFDTGVISLINGGDLTITGCLFQGNTAVYTYSVIVTNDATLTLKNSSFINNSASMLGAVSCSATIAKLNDVFFEGNSAIKGSCIYAASSSHVLLMRATFQFNRDGNVINCNSDTELSITDSEFRNHSSPADPLIDVSDSRVLLMNCIFAYNQLGVEGGIVHAADNGFVQIDSSHFEYNSARYGTIVFLSQNSVLHVFQSFFQHNQATLGGVFYIAGSSAFIKDSNFSYNLANSSGGAIFSQKAHISIEGSTLVHHKSPIGGILHLNDSTLFAYDTEFRNSSAHLGGVIYKRHQGKIIINSCSLDKNAGAYGGAIYSLESFWLRISNTTCNFAPITIKKGGCVDFDIFNHKYRVDLYTDNFRMDDGKTTISSRNPNFLNKSIDHKMIFKPGASIIHWLETPFASGECNMCAT